MSNQLDTTVEHTGINKLEHLKFVECPPNSKEVAVRVHICNADDMVDLNVDVTPELPGGWSALNYFSSATTVPTATPVYVLTYTVPVGKKLVLKSIAASGTNRAKYTVEINSLIQAVKRTYEPVFNVDFDFDRYALAAGDVLKVSAEHNRPNVSDHEVKLLGYLGDI